MIIEDRPIEKIIPYARNPRLNNASVDLVASSINEFGFRQPIVLDEDGVIIVGHTRMKAAQKLGMDSVPVHVAEGLSESQKRAYRIMDNRSGDSSEWDDELLSLELSDLKMDGFDLDLTGFDESSIMGDEEREDDTEPQDDRAEELRDKWGVETGQLWELGDHRLLCGDSTNGDDVARVVGGDSVAVCLTDPPYGLGAGKESGKNDYDQHIDSRENLVVLADGWLPIARDICNTVVFSPGVTNAWIYPEADWIMCWFYGGGQLLSSWGFNCWQPFLCYGKDPSLSSGNGGRPDAVDMNVPANAQDINHPCPKPLKLWAWFIARLSFEKHSVFYDPFSGSGTTIIACENLNRRCRAIEISPEYVAVALQRWADHTGREPRCTDGR